MTKDSSIVRTALDPKTPADFATPETTLGNRGVVKWRPVGDMEFNCGAMNAASDSRLALNERIINMTTSKWTSASVRTC